jgi:hypothetical protein
MLVHLLSSVSRGDLPAETRQIEQILIWGKIGKFDIPKNANWVRRVTSILQFWDFEISNRFPNADLSDLPNSGW